MADRYLYAAAATHTAPYTDPDTPAETLAQILALTDPDDVKEGEIIWVHASHVEYIPATITYTSPAAATVSIPQKLLCVDNFTDMNLSEGGFIGTETTAISRGLSFSHQWFIYGLTFQCGGNQYIYFGESQYTEPDSICVEKCHFYTGNNDTNNKLRIGGTTANFCSAGYIKLKDCIWTPGASTWQLELGVGDKYIDNLSIDNPSNLSTARMLYVPPTSSSVSGNTTILNSDFSTEENVTYLVKEDITSYQTIKLVNCRLPAGAAIVESISNPATEIYLINSDSGNTNYNWARIGFSGKSELDTGIYATTTPALYETSVEYSIRMEASANASRYLPLQSEWIHKWYEAGTHTINVECLVGADGAAALKDFELYLEVDYISGADSPLGSRVTTAPNILNTGTDVIDGTTAWTGDGYTTERTHKLSKEATSTKNGFIKYRVCLAKASTTIYFNPV